MLKVASIAEYDELLPPLKAKIEKITEKEIEKSILEYLERVPGCYAWKNQSTGLYDPTKKVFRKARSKYLINGVSDIIGIFNGKMLAIEVKTPQNKKRTEAQNDFIERINRFGGLAFYATSIQDVKDKLFEVKECA